MVWCGLLVNRVGCFVIAFLAIYLVRERGFSPVQAGQVLALYGLGATLAGPLGGWLADHMGRRITMIIALVGGAATVLALAFAHHPAAVASLAFLCALASDMYRPAMGAAVADVTPPEHRARAFGWVYWAVNVGMAAGLFVGGMVAERGVKILFIADAASSLLAALVIALRVPETRPAKVTQVSGQGGLVQVLADGPYVSFLALHLIALVVFTQWQLSLPLDMTAHGFGPQAYASLMALNCLGAVVLQPLWSARSGRFDSAWLMAASTVLFGLGFGLNAVGGSLWIYLGGTLLWTLGEVIGFPVASMLVANLAPVHLRGRYQGAFSMCWGLALTLSPLVGGHLMQSIGAHAFWLLCLGVSLVVAMGHLVTAEPRRARLRTLGATG